MNPVHVVTAEYNPQNIEILPWILFIRLFLKIYHNLMRLLAPREMMMNGNLQITIKNVIRIVRKRGEELILRQTTQCIYKNIKDLLKYIMFDYN